MSAVYDKAVGKTFVDGLRSVFLVDDAFPNFGDMFKSERTLRRFKEKERAAALYGEFRKRQLPCDIENTFRKGDIKMVERMRKCDLIVLDFHLDADDLDNTKSIEILQRLAESRHFNTVVVYTKADDLVDVWLDIAANLRSDLAFDGFLDGHEAELDWWKAADSKDWDRPTAEVMAQFMTGGLAGVSKDARTEIIKGLSIKGGGIDRDLLAEAWLRQNVAKRQNPPTEELETDQGGNHGLQGKFTRNGPHWIQCRGCFIAIIKKQDANEVRHLMSGLHAALLDWKPNFLQLLVSEIQNNLELESFAADPRLFSDLERQIGLSHYLLSELEEDGDQTAAVESVIDRMVETLRHRISSDTQLRGFAGKVLTDIRADLGDGIKSADTLENARVLAHTDLKFDPTRVMFLLNSFLSTEHFSKSRITTGTVFRDGADYWMVTSPACDLTARKAGSASTWASSLHPVKAMMAIKLDLVDEAKSLKNATQGRHAFIVKDKEFFPLRIFDEQTSQPAPEMFFTLDAGKTRFVPGKMATFKAVRIARTDLTKFPKLVGQQEFAVVGQLRANYASRVLQLTGAHFARIGIDFFKGA
ncbi:hypothetical protein FLL57_20345 [Rhodopseudomonas palustris]|uniref:response regulator receiver domain n=1 Tax=Rhodopseudomonas palustris TaxID=1076 RepID=UPI00115D42F0|nr:response regulator receiver domain [Rhodopseudomonas palustris]QDL99516.1 hypothetical protein FLL57_20345 [Rhodopseudomonas palustris]